MSSPQSGPNGPQQLAPLRGGGTPGISSSRRCPNPKEQVVHAWCSEKRGYGGRKTTTAAAAEVAPSSVLLPAPSQPPPPPAAAAAATAATAAADAPPPPPPCRSDSDCSPTTPTSRLWRCQKAPDGTAPAPSSAGNCHLPGPGTAGNATCACAAEACRPSPAAPSNKSSTGQYLVIGDSISLGLAPDLTRLLRDGVGWELTHNPGNAASSNLGAHCIDDWTRTDVGRSWDVVSFQFGLHDLGFDTERITVDEYGTLLQQIVHKLAAVQRASGNKTRLVWVTTTPVPTVPCYSAAGPCNDTSHCLNPPRFDRDVRLYNSRAKTVIAAANDAGLASIETVDLYGFVLERCGGSGYAHCDGFQLPNNVHYTSAGWTALAAEMYKGLTTGRVWK